MNHIFDKKLINPLKLRSVGHNCPIYKWPVSVVDSRLTSTRPTCSLDWPGSPSVPIGEIFLLFNGKTVTRVLFPSAFSVRQRQCTRIAWRMPSPRQRPTGKRPSRLKQVSSEVSSHAIGSISIPLAPLWWWPPTLTRPIFVSRFESTSTSRRPRMQVNIL